MTPGQKLRRFFRVVPKRLWDRFSDICNNTDTEWSRFNRLICTSTIYYNLVFLVIGLDTVRLIWEADIVAKHSTTPKQMIYFDISHVIFTSLYTLDFLIRVSSEMKHYFKNLYNVLDILVVLLYYTHWSLVLCYPYHEIYVGLRFIQGLRIIRIFRFIPQFRTLQSVVNALMYTLRTSVLDVIIISIMIIFTLSIVGNALFGITKQGPAYSNWYSFAEAFLTMWVYICGDGWLPYQDNLRQSGFSAGQGWSVLLIFVGNFIISNLFVGVISQNVFEASQAEKLLALSQQREAKLAKRELFFRKQQRDLMQLVQQKTLKNAGFQDIIRDLAGALRHDEIVPVRHLPMNMLWLETFVVTLHYHENTMFRCQQSHFAIAHALADYVDRRLHSKKELD